MGLGEIVGGGRTKTAHQYALKSLRDAILTGQLAGGTHLVQTELASSLDVSITPVREALRDLASEGLVVFDPHRGALVRSLDLEEVRELYELRIILEPLHIEKVFPKITDEHIELAESLRHRMESTYDLPEWAELNRQFHAALTSVDHTSRLATILAGLRDNASAFVTLSLVDSSERIEESNVEHAQLMTLYRNRDLEAIKKFTIQHLETTLRRVEESYKAG